MQKKTHSVKYSDSDEDKIDDENNDKDENYGESQEESKGESNKANTLWGATAPLLILVQNTVLSDRLRPL